MLLRCLHEKSVSLGHSGCEPQKGWDGGSCGSLGQSLGSQCCAAAQVVFLALPDDMPLAQSSELLLASCQLWNGVTMPAIPLGGEAK